MLHNGGLTIGALLQVSISILLPEVSLLSMVVSTIQRAVNRALKRPVLSLVLIVYKMPDQARNTLYSLSAHYQRGVRTQDYEVIVVENSSDRTMGADGLRGLAGNFRYFLRQESHPTPVHAIAFGAQKARGSLIGLMIDGARMATPTMVKTLLQASRVSANAVVAVPGYHLGQTVQQEAMNAGYNEQVETALLDSIDWKNHGQRLFEIGCFSASTQAGFFKPLSESNCLVMPRSLWNKVGGIDQRFTTAGGGLANLDLYKRVCELKESELIIAAGEGTFHQFHGGVTTGQKKAIRDQSMAEHFEQYRQLRGSHYTPPNKPAMIFGRIPASAMPYMQHSVTMAMKTATKETRG
jgi:hypothetical protein